MIRTVARALLIQDNALLAVQYADGQGAYYALPGGGQHDGEPLPETLRRECREEIGVDVDPGELLFVREWVNPARGIHQVEFVFRVSAPPVAQVTIRVPDGDQIGVEWIPLDAALDCRLYPVEMRTFLPALAGGKAPISADLGFGT